jgi:hypothetical protein
LIDARAAAVAARETSFACRSYRGMTTDQPALSAGRGLSASPLRADWPLWRRLLHRTYCELT